MTADIKQNGNSKPVSSDKPTILQRTSWICNTIFHQAVAVITIFIMWITFYYFAPEQHFTWHIALSTIAYIPLMAEAIVLFGSDNVWSQKIDRTTKYWIHGILLLISAILVSIGIVFIIDQKSGNHFVSIHAWTGLVSWIFVLLSQFLGLGAAKPQFFRAVMRPVHMKFLHNLLGLVGYVFGIVSLAYGLETRGFASRTSPESRMATYYVLGLVTFWSILAALKSAYEQLKSIVAG